MGDVKKIPMKVIKDKAEYDYHKLELENFLNEYYWFLNSKNPIEEVKVDIKTALNKLDDVNHGSIEESEILKQIHLLQVKYDMLIDGTYEQNIMDNIRAETMMIDEFEIRSEIYSFGKFFKGIITGDEKAKKLLGYMVLRNNGREVTPTRIDVTPSSKVLLELAKSYKSSWVDIDSDEIEEMLQKDVALVPYQDVAVSKIERDAEGQLQVTVQDLIKQYNNGKINSTEIRKTDTDNISHQIDRQHQLKRNVKKEMKDDEIDI